MEVWYLILLCFVIIVVQVCGDNLESCQKYAEAGFTANDQYIIDADGETGILSPFTVSCDMSESAAITIIHHDNEARTLVQGFDESGSYSLEITYGSTSLDQILAVIADAASCKQWIQYDCFHSAMNLQSSSPNAWWEDYLSTQQTYWGDSDNTPGYCACGLTGTCVDVSDSVSPGLKCYCDHNDANWRSDSGFLTDKSVLPVTRLRFGDTGDANESGYHTLGPLQCTGSIPTTSPPITAPTVKWVDTTAGIAVLTFISIFVVGTVIGLICICFRHTVIGCCKECGTGCQNCCWAFGSGCRGCCDVCGLNCRDCLDNCCKPAPPPTRKPATRRWPADSPNKNNEIIMAPTKKLQNSGQKRTNDTKVMAPPILYAERRSPVNKVTPSRPVDDDTEPRSGRRSWQRAVNTVGVLNNWRKGSRPHNAVYNTNVNESPATMKPPGTAPLSNRT